MAGPSNTARSHGPLWSRLADAFHGRDADVSTALEDAGRTSWTVDPRTDAWWHRGPAAPAGFQEIQARRPDEYVFARLTWRACDQCRLGLIAKIRVTDLWHRHGYGSRMVRFALRDRDGYAWTTTPQSDFAQAFFPAIALTTGVEFPAKPNLCEHMRTKTLHPSRPWQRLATPPR